MSSERVLIQEYATTDDAKAAEDLLIEQGANRNMVFRAGKKVRVIPSYESRARELLGLGATGVMSDAYVGIDDPLVTPGAALTAEDVALTADDPALTTASDDLLMDTTTTPYAADTLATEPIDYSAADLAVTTTDTSTPSTASSVTDSAKGAASSAAGTAQQAASTVADTAQQAASTVADTTQHAVATTVDTAQQAASTAVEKVSDATDAVTSQVSRVTSGVAAQVEALSDTVEQKGMTPAASGPQRTVVQTTTSVLDKLAQYLRNPDGKIILEDVRGAVRRSPGRSLLVGLGLGYLLRGVVAPSGGQSGGTSESLSSGASGSDASMSLGTGMSDTPYTDALVASDPTYASDSLLGTVPAYGDLSTADVMMDDQSDVVVDEIAVEPYSEAASLDMDTIAATDVLVFDDVDPATGEAGSVTSTTVDEPLDPLNPRPTL